MQGSRGNNFGGNSNNQNGCQHQRNDEKRDQHSGSDSLGKSLDWRTYDLHTNKWELKLNKLRLTTSLCHF